MNTLAFIFFIPFTLNIASFISLKESLALAFAITADLLALVFIWIILAFQVNNRLIPGIRTVMMSVPLLFIVSLLFWDKLRDFLTTSKVFIPLLMAASLANLYILRKEKQNKSLLFWSVLCLMGAGIFRLLDQSGMTPYLFILFKLSAYLIFTLYFHREIYAKLTAKIEEAEKKITAVNKKLDFEVKKRIFEIERSNEKLVSIAKTDALTKAYNKAAILEVINHLIDTKPTKEFTILMFDIDHFKTINDTLGHIEGDKCIKKTALLAQNSIRDIDSLGRYGGDEFIIVLPEASLSHAKLVAERFRKRVAETENPHFTVSIGLANYPNDARTVKDLISIADEGLYQSKKKGRNAVSHKNLY
ncbi:MAG: GGDEF domain-containing protein [Clostridia bacterium]|nr:GGDEF domain-containing protein [Clostridia bacterium]